MKTFIPQIAFGQKVFLAKTVFVFLMLTAAFHGESQVNVTLQSSPPLCGGFSTGIITANPTGGTSPYSYLWSNGGSTQTITNLPPASYTVTVTDDLGNTATASTILNSPPPLVVNVNVLNCGLPGVLNANASGGVPTYEYEWSNGETTPTIANLTAGEYCVTVVDQNSCAFVTCQSVGPLLGVEVETTPVLCGGSTGGTATANITGGVQPWNILWNNGETTETIDSLPPGTYTVTVVSINGCTAEASGEVGIGPGNFDLELEASNPTCVGESDGEITALPSGGVHPYSFSWTNGDTTQTISGLDPDIYSVTVEDAIGCTSTASTVLNYQSNMEVTLVGVDPTCAGATNGSASAFPSDGVEPYEYVWSNGGTGQMIANAGAGNYSVTVTDSIGCTISETTALSAPPAFSVNVSSTNASECGASDGSVSAMPTGGGSPPFSYQWSNGATGNVLNGIPAGIYTVTVTSSQGCTATGTATVEQPNDLEVEISGSSLVCENANNGTLTASVDLGNPPYTFEWNNGANTQTINNLSPGNYSVTVTSTEGCTGSSSANILGSPAASIELFPQNLTCFENSSGQVESQLSGGAPPFAYLWSNGSTLGAISNLPAGQYSLTVTDDNGCSAEATTEVFQPDEIQIIFDTQGSCGANGSASANVSGGTPNFTYLWSNGQTTSGIFGLAPGNFTVTVTDANGCVEIQTANVPAFPLVQLNVSSTNTTCNGTSNGTVTAEVTNGTAPFSYQWSNGSTQNTQTGLPPGNYSVTVTDDNGCQSFGSAFVALGAGLNVDIDAPAYVCSGTTVTASANASGGMGTFEYLWSNGQTTQTATGLTAGNYSVTVSDPSNCTGEATVFILPGGQFEVQSTQEDVECFGETTGSISLSFIGGATPFNILWSNGATLASIENLPAGNYSVTVSDQSECGQVSDFEITQPDELILDVLGENGTCGNLASASANATGGTTGYSFLWSNGSSDPTIENLPTGTYSVTVTDANGCSETGSVSVEVIPSLSCEIELTQVISTVNGNDGALTCQPSGGSPPFSFLWSNGETTAAVSGLSAGTHSVTVTDANDCETECEFTLLNPAKLGDFVWLDENMDGLQSTGESGFEGVEITLTGEDDYGNSVSENTTSDATGMYMFTVQPGTYKLTVALPADHIFTEENAGDDNLDSDVNGLTNMTPEITLSGGEVNMSIDIGLFESPCENVTNPGAVCCDQTLCGPGLTPAPFTETEAPSGGVGPIEFLWMYSTVPGPFDPATWIPISSATEAEYSPGAIFETTYFVRCVRREGCALFLESNQITVTVDNQAVAEIDGPNSTCVGDTVNFSAAANGAGANYIWTFESGTPNSSNQQDVTGVVWNSFGLKMVTLTVENNGCTSYDTLLVNVSNSPTFCGTEFIISGELIAPTTVEISWDLEIGDTTGLDFQTIWAVNQSDFEFIGEPDFAEKNGNIWSFKKRHDNPVRGSNFYRVILTENSGEIIESNIIGIIIEENDGYLVEVFPNPFSDKIKVDVINRFDTKISLDIFDSLGRKIDTFEVPNEGNYFEIPTIDYAAGTYFIFVKYGGSPQKIFKLIK